MPELRHHEQPSSAAGADVPRSVKLWTICVAFALVLCLLVVAFLVLGAARPVLDGAVNAAWMGALAAISLWLAVVAHRNDVVAWYRTPRRARRAARASAVSRDD